jgi:hypothetical protein
MLRTPLNLNYMKRTIRPLYANTQATPKGMFLDPAWAYGVDIYPGMAVQKLAGNVVTLLGGNSAGAAGSVAYGLSDFFEAPKLGIRQITDSGINACAVWVMDADAEFQVLAPAFDAAQTWTDPSAGTGGPATLVCAYTAGPLQGALHPAGITGAGGNTAGTAPIARLLSVNNISVIGGTAGQTVLGSITIGGLQARTA